MITRFSEFILPALFCLLMALNHTVFAANKTPASILVLGDSLSGAWGINTDEGWVALLQQKLLQQGLDYTVINASVSGDTTRTGLSRIETALKEHQPTIVIVALGGNDGLRGLAFSEIENSLASIIERCQKAGAEVLLSAVRLPPNYGPVYTDQFAALYSRLSERYKVPLVPRLLHQVAENRELMQEDGIHPTAAAQPQIMQNVWAGLEPMVKGGE
jgi:acyl-CoA thioesterase-1